MIMLIVPVMNLKATECVHLSQGDLENCTVFSDDPIDIAGRWMDAGAQRLHLFDVDGAIEGETSNSATICQVAQRFPNLPIQVMGGIRTLEAIESYFKAGVKYVCLSSKAIEDADFVTDILKRFPEQIIVCLDIKAGRVSYNARGDCSDLSVDDWVRKLCALGAEAIIYNDLERGGSMQGVDIDEVSRLAKLATIPLFVSGGVADMDDIRGLYAEAEEGIAGVLIGTALDKKKLTLVEAQRYCDE